MKTTPLALPESLQNLPYPPRELADQIEALYLTTTPNPISIAQALSTTIQFIIAVIASPRVQSMRQILDQELHNCNQRNLAQLVNDVARASTELTNTQNPTQEHRRRVGTLNSSLNAALKAQSYLEHGITPPLPTPKPKPTPSKSPRTPNTTTRATPTPTPNTTTPNTHTAPLDPADPQATLTREQLNADPRWQSLYPQLSPKAQYLATLLPVSTLELLLTLPTPHALSNTEHITSQAPDSFFPPDLQQQPQLTH